jgi:hypothetical protein
MCKGNPGFKCEKTCLWIPLGMGGGGDYQPTKLVISEFSSALKVGFPSKDFICDWKSYRVRQGKRKIVCKCVDVGSLSLIKIPVEIGRKSASFWARKRPNCVRGKNPRKAVFRSQSFIGSQPSIYPAEVWRIFCQNGVPQ